MRRSALTLALALASLAALAQQTPLPAVCGPDARMELKCVDACIICDIDGFTGRNDNGGQQDEGDRPPTFCTSINHNIQWIGFLAGSRELTLELTVSNCEKGGEDDWGLGLEAGVYEVLSCDVDGAVPVSNCNSGIPEGRTAEFVMDDLVPGNYYYFTIDGNNGDICDYTIAVTRGTTKVPDVTAGSGVEGPSRLCGPGRATFTTDAILGAPYYAWTVDGEATGVANDRTLDYDFPAEGTYEVCVEASNLCARDRKCRTVRVNPSPPTTVPLSACPGGSVEVAGETYTASATVTRTLAGEVGCDSVVTYVITIPDEVSTALDAVVCAGEAYPFHGRDLTQAGTYTEVLTADGGCDSTVTLTLAVRQPTDTSVAAEICAGEAYPFHGRDLTQAGTYTEVLTADNGCDSVVTLALTVRQPSDTSLAASICNGGAYDFYGRALTATGTYTEVLAAENGCDSTVTLALTVTDAVGGGRAEEVCAGETYRFNDRLLDASGVYVDTFTAANGCDSTYALTLTVAEAVDTLLRVQICAGADYEFHGRTLTASGTHTETLTAVGGCDSVVTLELTVVDRLRTPLARRICPGGAFDFDGEALSEAGTYVDTLRSASGCDSIVTLTLTVADRLGDTLAAEICPGGEYAFRGRTLTEAGTYTDTLASTGGCDSVVTLVLAVTTCDFAPAATASPVRCAGDADGAIDVSVTGPAADYDLLYALAGGPPLGRVGLRPDGTPERLGPLAAGTYELTWVSSRGGVAQRTVTIADPPPLRLTLESMPRGDFDVTCAGGADGQLTAVASGGTPPYDLAWGDGARGLRREGLAAGPQRATLTDDHGCEAAAVDTLTEPPPIRFAVDPVPEGCDPGVSPGGASVSVLDGGQPPLRVYDPVRDGYVDPADTILLGPGRHQLIAVDRVRCREPHALTVRSAERAAVSVEAPSAPLRPRETVTLRPDYEGPIVRYAWTGEGLACTDCPFPDVTPEATPDDSAAYRVVVATATGCTDTARVLLRLRPEIAVYAPNAISPDGDGVNDAFTVYTPSLGAVVERLEVFTRWGERVFLAEEVPPNDPHYGWGGQARGRDMDAAVFVYLALVRFRDGRERLLKGDLTLMR